MEKYRINLLRNPYYFIFYRMSVRNKNTIVYFWSSRFAVVVYYKIACTLIVVLYTLCEWMSVARHVLIATARLYYLATDAHMIAYINSNISTRVRIRVGEHTFSWRRLVWDDWTLVVAASKCTCILCCV